MLLDLSKITDKLKKVFFFFFKRKITQGLGSKPLIEKFNLSIADLRLNRGLRFLRMWNLSYLFHLCFSFSPALFVSKKGKSYSIKYKRKPL